MADWLVDLGRSPQARSLVKSLGLPLPLPAQLERERGTWAERPLMERAVIVGAAPDAQLLREISAAVARTGANPYLAGVDAAAFADAGEAYGRPARPLEALGDGRAHGLLFDASSVTDVHGLRKLYDFYHPVITRVGSSGRVVVVARSGGESVEGSMIAGALAGFIKSVAKEVGGKGATANLVLVDRGAESNVAPVLAFFLSARSAFVSGQALSVGPVARDWRSHGQVAADRALDRKVAIVTGAARGIGEATARTLAAQGAHVVCVDRPEDDTPTSELARAIGGTPVGLDVTAADAAIKLVDAVKPLGGVDIVVQNAGITRDKTLGRMSEEQWDLVMAVNLSSVVKLTIALEAAAMRDAGRIVCLSSIAGIAGNNGQTNYAASKGGVAGFVRALGRRLGRRGITVNAVAPGFIETRMTASVPVAIREAGRRLSALGQGGLPEDVAQAIAFLSSPGAQGVTGQVLRVCGGAFIGA